MRRDISDADAAEVRKRPFPIQGAASIPWELAERAWQFYDKFYGCGQSLERLAQRGGFGIQEFACLLAGHAPKENHPGCIAAADSLGRRLADLEDGLKQSLKLQSHYAELLNMHDGGERKGFTSVPEWLARLAECRKVKS